MNVCLMLNNKIGMKSISIGRDDSNHYIINDESKEVSRHHAVLKIHKNKVFIQDLGSANKTYVNSREIPQYVDVAISWGDNVSFAGIENLDWKKVAVIADDEIQIYTVGTKAGNTILLHDNTGEISRNHAVFEIYKDGTIFLTDYSSNGTWINDKKINNSKVLINKNDKISFANVYDFNLRDLQFDKKNGVGKTNYKKIGIPIFAIIILGLGYLLFYNFTNRNEINIVEKYKNSIGLVYQEYYYLIIDKDIKDTLVIIGDNQSVEKYSNNVNLKRLTLEPMKSTGSGFFISDDAKIITNRHVSNSNKLNEEEKNKIEKIIGDLYSSRSLNYKRIEIVGYNKYLGFACNERRININNIKDDLFDINMKNIKESFDPNIDLSLIQLDIQKLPKGCTYINLEKDIIKNIKEIEVGSEASILGYPVGLDLAVKGKRDKLNATYNQGVISKISNEYEIQYDIPSFGGASGSPVFDKKTGKLIAINYLKMTSTQGFNFGIIATHINSLTSKY